MTGIDSTGTVNATCGPLMQGNPFQINIIIIFPFIYHGFYFPLVNQDMSINNDMGTEPEEPIQGYKNI